MSLFSIRPAPIRDPIQNSQVWLAWFRDLQNSLVNFVLDHNSNLGGLQGGNATERYHLSADEYAEVGRGLTVTETAIDLTLTDAESIVVVTATGKTVTLPAASSDRIGKVWTVMFTAAGTCTVTTQGADSFATPASATETSLIYTQRGQSHTFRCLTASTWGIE